MHNTKWVVAVGLVLAFTLFATAILAGMAFGEVFDATPHADQIEGTSQRDYLFLRAGDDTGYGRRAADELYGDAGADTLYGNRGADFLIGGPGADTCIGGPGVDRFDGSCEVRIAGRS